MKRLVLAGLGALAVVTTMGGERGGHSRAGMRCRQKRRCMGAVQLDRLLYRYQRRRRLGPFGMGNVSGPPASTLSGGVAGGTIGYN